MALSVESSNSMWAIREAEEADREGVVSLLSYAYTRSRAGQRAGASRQGVKSGPPTDEDHAKRRDFIDAHEPIWEWLLDNAKVTLVVDSSAPHVIWAWLLTSEPNIVHAVGCKSTFCERVGNDTPLSVDIIGELLGDRLDKHQVVTTELPQLRLRGYGTIGIDRPAVWSMDPTLVTTRMLKDREFLKRIIGS